MNFHEQGGNQVFIKLFEARTYQGPYRNKKAKYGFNTDGIIVAKFFLEDEFELT